MAFTGFPAAAFEFYEALAADNSRTWWQANKERFRTDVREPMDGLLAELGEFGPFHVFRPYQDVRFAKGRPPYKEHIGAYGEAEGGTGYYVQLSSAGLLIASGYYAMRSDQLERFRHAVDDEHRGGELEAICAKVVKGGMRLGAIDELKTAPRGYPKDHPRITFLRRKGLMASREYPVAAWMSTKGAVKRVRDAWTAAAAMNAWLDTHVGPSTLEPDEGRFF